MNIDPRRPSWQIAPAEQEPAAIVPEAGDAPPRERRAAAVARRLRPFAPAVQSTLDQFLGCIEGSNAELRNVALADFLLATETLAPEIRRSGTSLGALQLAALSAVMQAAAGEGQPAGGLHFGLAELKALLVARMGAARRSQMLAGSGAMPSPQQRRDGSVRFALLPLMVLNANRPRPPLHRRQAADRADLVRAGLALARAVQAAEAGEPLPSEP